MSKVLVIGGGAAGMFAAIAAAECGHEVHIFEKNEKFGKKIYITGKGRCNLTNNCEVEDLLKNVSRNQKFLYSAFYSCTSQNVIDFFESCGCKTKTERGNRVFPTSDHASDVIAALVSKMKQLGVHTYLNTEVKEILYKRKEAVKTGQETSKDDVCNLCVTGIRLAGNRIEEGDKIIVTTGGMSYPSTGSTGDGYAFAKLLGHKVTRLLPSLVPFEVKEDYVKELQGLSLKNVRMTIYNNKKILFDEFGEMLFTHFGVSGPLVLSGSSVVGEELGSQPELFSKLKLEINLKPALSAEQLEQRILREFGDAKNKQFKNILGNLFPSKLIPVMIQLSGIPEDKKINTVTREERQRFVELIQHFPMTVTGYRSFKEAIITKGGVSVKEINPSTMESKLCSGLYFAGEVLDVDGVTGGFNLQIAWSTGYLAGISV